LNKDRAFSFQCIAEDKCYDGSKNRYHEHTQPSSWHALFFVVVAGEHSFFVVVAGEHSFFVVVPEEHSIFVVVAGEHSFFVVGGEHAFFVVAGENSFFVVVAEEHSIFCCCRRTLIFCCCFQENTHFLLLFSGEHITAVPTAAAAGQPSPCAAQHGGSHPHHRAHQQVRGPTRNYLPQGSPPLDHNSVSDP
jgi:hypothetical protein